MLLKFSRLEHVQNYIEVIHLEYQGRERQYFQLLFLDIKVHNMSDAAFRINRTMRRLQKNKSTAQRQECLSVSDMTVQHEKRKCMNTTKIQKKQNQQDLKKLKNVSELIL